MPQINTIKNVYEEYETRGQPQNTMLHQGNIAYNDRGCKYRVNQANDAFHRTSENIR